MILSSQTGTLSWHHFARTKKALPEDEKQALKKKNKLTGSEQTMKWRESSLRCLMLSWTFPRCKKCFFSNPANMEIVFNYVDLSSQLYSNMTDESFYVKHVSGVIIPQKRLTSSDFVLEK